MKNRECFMKYYETRPMFPGRSILCSGVYYWEPCQHYDDCKNKALSELSSLKKVLNVKLAKWEKMFKVKPALERVA